MTKVKMGKNMSLNWTWDDANFWANWILAGSLIVGVLATITIIVSGNIKESALKRELAASNERTAGLEREAENARLELEKMKQAQLPRKLTQEMQVRLEKELKPFSGQKILVSEYAASTEAIAFSAEIESALKKAGWVVTSPGIWISPALEPGVLIFISEDQAQNPAASALVKALTECGFVARYTQEDRRGLMGSGPLTRGEIGMLVCPKP